MRYRPARRASARSALAALLALHAGWAIAQAGGGALPAQSPSVAAAAQAPIFQIDGGMHSALISGIRTNRAGDRLYSISWDRTLRVWQLPQLQLLRTLRVPAAPGNEGMLMSMAVAPDGDTVAVAGWTGLAWRREACVYVWSVAEERLSVPRCGLPEIVTALAYSPDGQHLAVGLGGTHGVQVRRLSDWSIVASDGEFNMAPHYLEFSIHGTLAATSSDGYLRLYDPAGKLVGRVRPAEGMPLGGVRFSPDGKRLAVGVTERPTALVYDAGTLALLHTLRVDDAQQVGLCCMGWSAAGDVLFGNGQFKGQGATPLYRFSGEGFAQRQVLRVGDQGFTNMAPLPSGELVFATDTPALGLVGQDGTLKALRRAAVADFRQAGAAFQIADDGWTVAVGLDEGGQRPVAFSVRELQVLGGIPAGQLSPARREGPVPPVSDWDDSLHPKVGGVRLPLAANERSLSYGWSDDGQWLALGTMWAVRLYERAGKALWERSVPGAVHNIAVTRDGAFVVATVSDGTVRWFAAGTGQELAALFLHANGRDWVFWRPDGYYASSDHGDEFAGWIVPRGASQPPDFFRAVQFERVFFRPDLARAALAGEAATPTAGAARSAGVTIEQLAQIAPPRVQARTRAHALQPDGTVEVTLAIEAEQLSAPMQELTVYVNSIPVLPLALRTIDAGSRERLAREVKLRLTEPTNAVRVEVGGARALGLAEAWVAGPAAPPAARARLGTLRVIAAGVNEVEAMPAARLGAPVNDAREFSSRLARAAQGLYERVEVTLLADGQAHLPTKANVMRALESLAAAGPNDTTVVFLAAHGISDPAGNYYFVGRDAQQLDVDGVLQGRNVSGQAKSLLGWTEIFDALRMAAGRRVLVIDTCSAGNVTGERTPAAHSLRKRSAASQFALVLASKGDEESQEPRGLGHGAFTYALLQAIDGKAVRTRQVTLRAAFEHVARAVPELRYDKTKSQTPQLIAPVPLEQLVIAERQ